MNTIDVQVILYRNPHTALPQWDAGPQAATTAIEWLVHARTDNLTPYSEADRITPRPAAFRGTSARTASGTNFRDKRPCYQTSSSMLWRIDNNTLANDEVHCLPVDVGPNHFEFERVIYGQDLAGLRRQQLGPSLNL